jgi:hypothetical protein
MADVLFLALIVGLFALAVLLVMACDRVIGPAEESRDRVEPVRLEDAA